MEFFSGPHVDVCASDNVLSDEQCAHLAVSQEVSYENHIQTGSDLRPPGCFHDEAQNTFFYNDKLDSSYDFMDGLYKQACIKKVPPFDENLAVELAALSTAAYCAVHSLKSWTCGDPCIPGFTNSMSVYNPSTGAAGFVGKFHGECLVSFRGSGSIEQWQDNAKNVKQVKLDGCSHEGEDCRIGYGFHHQYQSIRYNILAKLESIGCGPGAKLTLTGHSLGGTLANVAAFDFDRIGFDVAMIYTFGQPRGGNRAWAKALWKVMSGKPFYRLSRKDDPAVHVPPPHDAFNRWVHSGREVYYQGNTDLGYRVCRLAVDGDPFCASQISEEKVSALTAACRAQNGRYCSHHYYMYNKMPFRLIFDSCSASTTVAYV